MNRRDLVVVGASAGGVSALRTLVSKLPADFPAALLIVLHIGSHRSVLPDLLASSGRLRASHALDGAAIEPGRILVAPPDRHLLVDGPAVRLSRGPKEHHSRPAVDPLFGSAALSHGPRVVGLVLTGRLDDGTAGLQAIKACGGIAVVQHPDDALEPSMPASALKYVETDHCLPLDSIPALLVSLAGAEAVPPAPRQPHELVHEHQLSLSEGAVMEHLEAIGRPSPFACPECKGGLWELDGPKPTRYRCHTGHGYSLRSLQHAQSEATDEAVWSAVRALQEKQLLHERSAAVYRSEGDEAESARLERLAAEAAAQAGMLRKLAETTARVGASG